MKFYKQNIFLYTTDKYKNISTIKSSHLLNYLLYKLIWMNAKIVYTSVYDNCILQIYYIHQPKYISNINKKILRFGNPNFPRNHIKKIA